MLVHNLVVTGSLTFPTSLPLSGSLLISGSLGIGTPTPDPGAVVTINKTGTGLQDVMYLTNTQAAAADTGVNLWWLGTTSLNSIGRITAAFTGGTVSTSYMSFYTRGGGTNSEKMRISSSGSVGIGTNVLGWDDALITALQIKNASFYGYSTSELGIVQNAQVQGGWKYISTGAASYQVSAGGGHAFYTAPSGNASASVTWTERLGISNAGSASFNNGNSLASAADAATITIKQLSTVATNGIYLERSGEQKGYYIYMGGAVDSLTFQRNNAGTKGDVMSLTRDGNVGIGTNSPSTILDVRKATASGDTQFTFANSQNSSAGNTSVTSTIYLGFNDDGGGLASVNKIVSGKSGDYTSAPTALSFLAFYTTNNNSSIERMRLTSDNIILMGTTSTGTTNSGGMIFRATNAAFGGVIIMNHSTTNNTSAGYIDCYYNTSYIGGIAQNGGSNVSFLTSSDYRLKEDLKDFDGLNLVSSLKVYDFKWKADDSRMYGVIAHEAQEVIPYIVSGDKDEMKENGKMKIQVVDYSKLTPILIKAIQEQQTTIETLTTRITALEN